MTGALLLALLAAAPPARPFADSQLPAWVLVSLLLIYLLGSLKVWLRLSAAGLLLPGSIAQIRRTQLMFYVLWPLVSLLFLYDFIASAATRKVQWRGIWYEMRSPTETVVLNQPKE